MRDACDKSGAECIVLEIPRSALIDDDELAALLERQLAAAPHIKFALLDHITSPTAVVLPIARLVAICHSHGVEVMVDGAHAPGNVLPQLDIPAIGADWYTGNLHKWWCAHAPPEPSVASLGLRHGAGMILGGDVAGSFTPKGSAFLWVSKAQQPRAQGVVISHEYKAEDFQERFAMQGTLDDTAFITVPTALQVPPRPPLPRHVYAQR